MADTVFATVDDIELRWHTLSDTERQTAEALIADASAAMLAQCPECGTRATESARRAVCCALVIQRMQSVEAMGVTQVSQTVGPVTESMSYGSGGSGDFWLSSAQRALLGYARRQTAFHVSMWEEDS